MSTNNKQLEQWFSEITKNLPNLTKPQAFVLALWNIGMTIVKSCGLTSVVNILAPMLSASKDKKILKQKRDSLRQRLRQWCYDANDKTGNKRSELNVETCFPFLLKWIMNLWKGKQLALALYYPCRLPHRSVTVLVVSVLYPSLRWDGCAIPVAWTILKGNEKQSWRREYYVKIAQTRNP